MPSDRITGPPGVGLRIGSVVRDVTHPTWVGVIADKIEGMVLVCWKRDHEDMRWRGTRYLALDLTDPTSRTHAVWAVAEAHSDADAACVAGGLLSVGALDRTIQRPDAQGVRVWLLVCITSRAADPRGLRTVWRRTLTWCGDVVPALRDLDPTDDTCLPDGSRVVDAQALSLVMAHLWTEPAEAREGEETT